MDTKCATILLLKQFPPNSLIGLEVSFGQLSPTQKLLNVLRQWQSHHLLIKILLSILESTYKITHTLSVKGFTKLFQEYEGIQHQLKDTHHNSLVEQPELSDDVIMHCTIK